MSKIKSIHALEILDSRGSPTIEVILETDKNILSKSKIPSGASVGKKEALELRDKDPKRYFSKGVKQAVYNVNTILNDLLKGVDVFNQEKIDQMMIEKDGTENKSSLGANAILAVSMAAFKAAALSNGVELYRHFANLDKYYLPCPMMNIINGGAHADNNLDFQEFMIRPIGAPSMQEAIRYGAEIFHALKTILKNQKLSTAVGDEGGFAPLLQSNEQALDLIIRAIEKAGYRPQEDITIALDVAASEFFDFSSNKYIEKKKKENNLTYFTKTSHEMIEYYKTLQKKYPIDSIEDGLSEDDWKSWQDMTEELNHIQLVGDDIFVTNPKILKRAIETKTGNSILIKLNQIGTVTETLNTIKLAQDNNFKTIISHRSGETEDTFIADLAVGISAKQIKTGSLSRSDRIAKYNRLLEIEDLLQEKAIYSNT